MLHHYNAEPLGNLETHFFLGNVDTCKPTDSLAPFSGEVKCWARYFSRSECGLQITAAFKSTENVCSFL